MRTMLQILCVFLLSLQAYGQGFSKYKVSGTLTQSSNYCGGAAPSPEQVAWYSTARPHRAVIYLKEAAESHWGQPILDSVTTDENGYFEFWLEPGEYTLLTANQNDQNYLNSVLSCGNQYVLVDEECVRNWFAKGLFQVSVSNEFVENLNYNFYNACFVPYAIPCLQYSGPYPP